MKKRFVKKESLNNTIECFIYKELGNTTYEIKSLTSKNLLTWNRFDLGFKLLYLELKDKNNKLGESVYYHDIRSQTLGAFKEFGNKDKVGFYTYVEHFNSTFSNIKLNGFDERKSLIPLSNTGTIINGAHRLSSAIYLKKDVDCVLTELNQLVCDYKYFYERNVPSNILDMVAKKIIDNSDNIYIAFLWPSGQGLKKKAESIIQNVVYKKEISLTPKGGYNLLLELYRHMDWVGTYESGFQGIKQKLIECFPVFEPVKVIAFQADNLDVVKKIKKKIRDVYNIGFSSIHITDTKEEAIRTSKLVFNENGIHFLNYADSYNYMKLFENEISRFKKFLDFNNVSANDILIDGSFILSLYGIRKSLDLDFLCSREIDMVNKDYESHDNQLVYHKVEKNDILYDPNFHFEYDGLKFISFYQLYKMKQNRDEEKDRYDCNAMNAFIEGNKFKKIISKINQSIFYFKIKNTLKIRRMIFSILKSTGLYSPLKYLYGKIKLK